MRILAFECSGETRSAALLEADRVVAELGGEGASRHAETLVPLIFALLGHAGWTAGQLDLLAVGRGPGSFTGVRIAVAAARGLALALDRPVLGIDGRDALLHGLAADAGTCLAAIDARRGGVYAAWRTGGAIRHAPTALPPRTIAAEVDGPLVLVGSGALLVARAAGTRARVVESRLDARRVGFVARHHLAVGVVPHAGTELAPLYLRAPDAVPRAA